MPRPGARSGASSRIILFSRLAIVISAYSSFSDTSYVPKGNVTSAGQLTTVTDLAAAWSCVTAKQKWILDSANAETEIVLSSKVETSTTTSVIPDASLLYYTTTETFLQNSTAYTLCDGFPRLDGNTTVITSTKSLPSTTTITATSTSDIDSTIILTAAPSCVIPSNICRELSSSWSSDNAAFNSSFSSYQSAGDLGPAPTQKYLSPICTPITSPVPILTGVDDSDPLCFVPAATVKLLYWPVSTVSGNLCRRNGSTVTMSETVPGMSNTYQTLNKTLYSPTNYIEVLGTWHFTSGATTLLNQTSFLIPMSAASVSSICGSQTKSVDYANFNYPVPASAYFCQSKCLTPQVSISRSTETSALDFDLSTFYTSGEPTTYVQTHYTTASFKNKCSTIWDDYAPELSVPQAFFSMEPFSVLVDGVSCAFAFTTAAVFYDPPTALTIQSSAATLTMPHAASSKPLQPKVSISAQPASTVTDSLPKVTNSATSAAPETAVSSVALPPSTTLPATSTTESGMKSSGAPGHSIEKPSETAEVSSGPSSTVDSLKTGLGSSAALGSDQSTPSSTETESTHGTSSDPLVMTSSQQGLGAAIASVLGLTRSSTVSDGNSVPTPTAVNTGDPVSSQLAVISDSLLPSVITATGSVPSGNDPDPGNSPFEPFVTSHLASGPASSVMSLSSGGVSGVILTGSDDPKQTSTIPQPGDPGLDSILPSSDTNTVVAGVGTVSVGGSGAVGSGPMSESSVLPTAQVNTPVITVGGKTYTRGPMSAYSLASSLILYPGGSAVTIAGDTVSLENSGSGIIINGVGQTLNAQPSQSTLAFAGKTVTAASDGVYTLGSSATLSPGGSAVVVSGTTYSLPGQATEVLVNGVSQSLNPSEPSEVTFAGQMYTAASGGAFNLGPSEVLSPGGPPIIISGSTISLTTSGLPVVVMGVTQATNGSTASSRSSSASSVNISLHIGEPWRMTTSVGWTISSNPSSTTTDSGIAPSDAAASVRLSESDTWLSVLGVAAIYLAQVIM